jgi:DNA repair protein RecO (recombination protein O)
MRRVQTDAIAVQRFAYRETSQIVHFLTPDLGRIGVLVRGAYRPKNSYQGPIDLLVKGRIQVHILPGRDLGMLLRREVSTAYPGVRQSLARHRGAVHLLQLLLSTVPVGHGEASQFHLLDRGLQALELLPDERVPLLLLSFDLHLLSLLGLKPELDLCVRCSGRQAFHGFSARDGGVICSQCQLDEHDGLPLREAAWRLLRAASERKFRDLEQPDRTTLGQARRLLEGHLAYHLDWRENGNSERRWVGARH